jgi:hypothetical protein
MRYGQRYDMSALPLRADIGKPSCLLYEADMCSAQTMSAKGQ